jgi:dTDP-4-amino-4,6-dideoxygalactose transaminase
VPSEIVGAFLYGQLEMMGPISERRRAIYEFYRTHLEPLGAEGHLQLPFTPKECTANYHMFYVLAKDAPTRDALMEHLRAQGISAVFHYVPLHSSPMGQRLGGNNRPLPVTDSTSSRLLRLPFYYTITQEEQSEVVKQITAFFRRAT